MSIWRIGAVALLICVAGPAAQAGGWDGRSNHCHHVEGADDLVSRDDVDDLRDEVEQRYDHAVSVAEARSTIYSRSPLFTWANEAKVSCAKALGYLKRRWNWRPVVHADTLQRCECFYTRMPSYLRH